MRNRRRKKIKRQSRTKWKPENLVDFLLAGKAHEVLLRFFGGKEAYFSPSELHVQKVIPDRVFWKGQELCTLELKVSVDSRTCAQLEIQRAITISHYVDQVQLSSGYKSKYEAALQNVKTILLSINHPSSHFKKQLEKQGFILYSFERGIISKIPLNYAEDPLPLVIADFRAKILTKKSVDQIEKLIKEVVKRKFSKEERLFLNKYSQLLQISNLPENLYSYINQLQQVTELTESDYIQILKEKIYLLSPEERLEGLKAEERLKGLKAEERLKGLNPEDKKKLLDLLLKEVEDSNK